MKLSNPAKSIITIVLVLLGIVFYESKRIETFSIGTDNSVMRSLGMFLSSKSEKIKSFLGISQFFENDEKFWAKIKESPKIFNYSFAAVQEKTATSTPAPLPLNVPLPLKLEAPYNILIVGDSFIAEGFGPTLEKELLSYQNIRVYRKGVYSTGLSRPDYFNWDEETDKLITTDKPNIAVVMFGANDGQDQRTLDGEVIHYGTIEWNPEYSRRVADFLKILNDNEIFVFWIGNPLARDDYYTKKMENLNSIYQSECQKSINCVYLSIWSLLADSQGKYSAYLPDKTGVKRLARASDGIHTTAFGSKILVREVINEMKEKMALEITPPPAPE